MVLLAALKSLHLLQREHDHAIKPRISLCIVKLLLLIITVMRNFAPLFGVYSKQ